MQSGKPINLDVDKSKNRDKIREIFDDLCKKVGKDAEWDAQNDARSLGKREFAMDEFDVTEYERNYLDLNGIPTDDKSMKQIKGEVFDLLVQGEKLSKGEMESAKKDFESVWFNYYHSEVLPEVNACYEDGYKSRMSENYIEHSKRLGFRDMGISKMPEIYLKSMKRRDSPIHHIDLRQNPLEDLSFLDQILFRTVDIPLEADGVNTSKKTFYRVVEQNAAGLLKKFKGNEEIVEAVRSCTNAVRDVTGDAIDGYMSDVDPDSDLEQGIVNQIELGGRCDKAYNVLNPTKAMILNSLNDDFGNKEAEAAKLRLEPNDLDKLQLVAKKAKDKRKADLLKDIEAVVVKRGEIKVDKDFSIFL